MMASDGEIEYEEIAHLLLGPDQGVALLSVENEMVIIPAKNLF